MGKIHDIYDVYCTHSDIAMLATYKDSYRVRLR